MSEWAPAAWKFIHACTFAMPDAPDNAQQRAMRAFLESLSSVLPCPACAAHWQQMLAKSPPPVHSRDELSRWCVDRHNEVNARLGKPLRDYASVARDHLSAAEPSGNRWILALVAVLVVIVCTLVGIAAASSGPRYSLGAASSSSESASKMR